jgi:hypothetical protein
MERERNVSNSNEIIFSDICQISKVIKKVLLFTKHEFEVEGTKLKVRKSKIKQATILNCDQSTVPLPTVNGCTLEGRSTDKFNLLLAEY